MQSTDSETWKPVVGYEGLYEVSDRGRVRSLRRVVMRRNGAPQTIPGRILSPANHRGYLAVHLRNREGQTRLVHQLVALAFLGDCPAGHEVCHADGTRTNNHVGNLRWGTRAENMQDALAHGTNRNARKTHCDRGHELTPTNTRRARNGQMRICVACRKRTADCPVCGEQRTHYGMKSHLLHAHRIEVKERSWQMAFPSSLKR